MLKIAYMLWRCLIIVYKIFKKFDYSAPCKPMLILYLKKEFELAAVTMVIFQK